MRGFIDFLDFKMEKSVTWQSFSQLLRNFLLVDSRLTFACLHSGGLHKLLSKVSLRFIFLNILLITLRHIILHLSILFW